MKLNFWKPTTNLGIIKATVHQSGKLGFSRAAIDKLNLKSNTYIKIGTNSEDKNDNCVYMIVNNEEDESSMKISKAGEYYYLNMKDFFNELGLDYKRKTIIFDIIEIDANLFKLIPREKERKKKSK